MRRQYWAILGVGVAIAVAIALLSPLASRDPDGLQRVAQDQGFAEQAHDSPFEVLSGYGVPGVENEAVSRILAALIGIAVVGGGMLLLARVLARRGDREATPPSRRRGRGRTST